MTNKNLADKLFDSLVLYQQIEGMPLAVQKEIMKNPALLLKYRVEFYTNNIAI